MANVSNNSDVTKFYQFIAQNYENAEELAQAIDACGNEDGKATKTEFRKFINEKWDGETALTDDLVNKFWKTLDVNKVKTDKANVFGSKDQADLDKKLVLYKTINTFIENNTDIQDACNSIGKNLKSDIYFELSNLCKNLTKEEDILKACNNNIEKILNKTCAENTASNHKTELVKTVLKDYSGYKIEDDKTLQKIIDAYIKYVTTPDENGELPVFDKNDLEELINAYFATAGLVKGDTSLLENPAYGYDNKTFNTIQLEVIKKSFIDEAKKDADVATLLSGEYTDTVNSAITEYIKNHIADLKADECFKDGVVNSTVITSLVNEFKNSGTYQNIVLLTKIEELFVTDLKDEEDNFYCDIKNMFGSQIAEVIRMDKLELAGFKKAINSVKEQIKAGTITTIEDAKAAVLKSIMENIQSIINASEISEIDTLAEIYNSMVGSKNVTSETIKSAALLFCKAVKDKYSDIIGQVFGTKDFETYINEKTSRVVSEKMKALIAKIKEVEEERKKLEPVTVTDKTNQITQSSLFTNNTKTTVTPTYYVNDAGKVVFVNFAKTHGVFDDDANTTLDGFMTQLKTQLQKTYESNLTSLSATEKENLFNLAVFMTVSDPSIIRSQYESTSLNNLMTNIAKTYKNMLEKVLNDEKAKEKTETKSELKDEEESAELIQMPKKSRFEIA